MKTKRFYQGIALLAVALTTAACQNELNEESSEPKPGEKINMTIRATQGTTPQTRTSYEDKLGVTGIDGIVVKWEGGNALDAPTENIKVFGYASGTNGFAQSDILTSEPGSLSADGFSITFQGKVTPAENYLAFYPSDYCVLDDNDNILFSFDHQTQDCTAGKEMEHLKESDLIIGIPTEIDKNNFTFFHRGIMLRFDLTLPTPESVNRVTLSSSRSLYNGLKIRYENNDLRFDEITIGKEEDAVRLDIKNHTASTALKAYMMVPNLELYDATLTINVRTDNGNTYEGKLTTTIDTPSSEYGKCYTLTPTLTLNKTIALPPVTAGSLKEKLDKITSLDPTQTELVVAGTVIYKDLNALVNFLNGTGQYITTLDLSGLTSTGIILDGCTHIKNIILPAETTSIASNAFEGCTALTEISLPAGCTRIGDNAFEGCTALTKIFLPASITSVENYVFYGCTALTALVFEGNKAVGTADDNIKLGGNIVANTNANLKVFLPAITDPAVATPYNTALRKDTPYGFADYSSATADEKVDSTKYTDVIPGDANTGGDLEDLENGDEWGN